jgi:hypothetical protein
MEKSVQWMTLQELRDELDRTRPAWDELADLDDVLEDGELPALSEDARRYALVLNDLLRRPQRLTLPHPCGDCCRLRPCSEVDESSGPLVV